MKDIRNLDEISKKDILEVGGKAASLGELKQARLPVPKGFVITTNVYNKLSKNLEKEIFEALDKLGLEKVAVRSSAIAEDSSKASWAGQLETYLNVQRSDLIASIQKCWRSIHSQRAKAYAKQQKVGEEDLKVAVIVQEMVDAKTAGVIFTVNPVTQNANELMIESVFGLGESLVQGSVTPDNFLVDRKTSRLLSKNIRTKPTLHEKQILMLTKMAVEVENYFKQSQDIEWAIDKNDKIWFLQSRPITTIT